MFRAIVKRFGLLPGRFDHFTDEQGFVTWHGKRLR
jgi:hypothetical protein